MNTPDPRPKCVDVHLGTSKTGDGSVHFLYAPGMTGIVTRSWFRRAWDVASDLLLATAVVWALPLLFGAVVGVFRLLLRGFSYD